MFDRPEQHEKAVVNAASTVLMKPVTAIGGRSPIIHTWRKITISAIRMGFCWEVWSDDRMSRLSKFDLRKCVIMLHGHMLVSAVSAWKDS